MEKIVLGANQTPSFRWKGLTDMTEFVTVEKAIYDFPIVVEFLHFRDVVVPFKTLQNLNPVEFSSPVFIIWKQNVAAFCKGFNRIVLCYGVLGLKETPLLP
jgi:hypothetical protein